ncbi:unnamed protein product, partial [Vitis vinifera]|uniref:Uncharacterized protein n=1 Tax=Vitis vinifera TaxID=29760 RepID=D7SSM1_VITVI
MKYSLYQYAQVCTHSMKPFQVVNAESQLESRQQFHENWGINIIQNLF